MITKSRAWLASAALALSAAAWVAPTLAWAQPASERPTEKPVAKVANETHERWYVVEVSGQRAGHAWTRQSTEPDGSIRTRSTMKMEIRRGSVSIPISMESTWRESAAGKPLSLESTSALGAMPIGKTVAFTDDGLAITTKIGAQKTEAKQPAPEGEWLTPAAAERRLAERLKVGDKTITLRTLEDEPGGALSVVTSTRTLVDKTTVEVFGRTVPALKWTVTIDRYPGIESTEFTDDQGHTLRSETNMGGLKMVQMLADKDLSLRPIDAPELLVSTLVTPDKPVPDSATRVTYVLSVPKGAMPDLPSTGAQKIERLDARRIRVTVLKEGLTNAPAPVGADSGTDPSYLASSPMINAADPAIVNLAKGEALDKLPPGASDFDKAKRLRAFVQKFIDEKSLSVGFASASEVARTRTGDCSEHGMLLAALLRASGIPARVVSGLIFADEFQGKKGIFGYHMWAQAWLASEKGGTPRWVDLDGTLRRGTVFGAGHIALGVSSMSDAQPQNFMVTLAPLLGRLKIEVEDTQP